MKHQRNLTDKSLRSLLRLDNGEDKNAVIVNKLLDSQNATDDERAAVYLCRKIRRDDLERKDTEK